MAGDSKGTYGYDPFSQGTRNRWGRRGDVADAPEIPGYEIIDNLGSGGMGAVWSARYISLNQIRAIKVLDKALAMDPTFIERFAQEAKALGRLQHPNIVRVFDADADHRPPFIAMQWVEGKTLSEVMAKRQLTTREALKYLQQIADALDHAHSLGFVHRDIKPSNVMITEQGQAMLIDFGVAAFLGADPSEGNTITGTTRYLSPEVIQGKLATKQSDLWALAVMIFLIFSGHLPFDGKSSDEVFRKVVGQAPADPKNVNSRVVKFFRKALEKDPSKRYRTATEMVKDLRGAIDPFPIHVKGEGLAVTAAFAMFGVVAIGIVGLLGSLIYATIKAPKTTTKVVIKERPAPVTPKEASSTTAPILAEIRGPWFADLGSQWAEVRIEPAEGNRFIARMNVRDSNGALVVDAKGEVAADGKTLQWVEEALAENDSAVAFEPGTFKGTISEDHSRLAGTKGEGKDVRLVRAVDLPLTPYENAQSGFVLAYPAGWAFNESEIDGIRSVTFAPIGDPRTYLRVNISPILGSKTILELFQEQEALLAQDEANGGLYRRLNVNEQATVGGRKAVSWEYRHQTANSPIQHGMVFGLLRGDQSLMVEAVCPADEDEFWVPLLERIRSRLQFRD